MKDQDSENGRIKAFIKNEKEGIPLHLIIGMSICPITVISDINF